jgi:hypothetical protein
MRRSRRPVLEPAASGAFAILPGRAMTLTSADVAQPDPSNSPAAAPSGWIELDPAEPAGAISQRLLVASEVLWHALETSPHGWRRSIALDGELMSFYSRPARLALEIVEVRKVAADAYDLIRAESGVQLVPVPISDVEQRCATIVGWLDALCDRRLAQFAANGASAS